MKISIITVCYNSALTIEDTLRSVAAQTHVDLEHIIVDGGSTDGTIEILKKWPCTVVSEPDKGIYDAMNKGLSRATGDVVGFLNADDYYATPNSLATIAAAFEGVDAVYGDLIYVDPTRNNRVVRVWRSRAFEKGLFLKGWCPAHPTFYVRKSVYDRCGVFDLNYQMGNDVELMMRFLECYNVKTRYIPEVLVHMRIGGVSNQHWRSVLLQNQDIIAAARNHGLPINVWQFIVYKLLSRLKQRVNLH